MDKKILLNDESGIVTVSLGSEEERTVILDEQRMVELRLAVEELSKRRDLRGVIFCGSRLSMFCAGADVRIIQGVTSHERGEELARLGQELFSLIEKLPVPTVAAISGPCVGGGCELVLACKYRIALDHPQTKIGLPEIKLGILPGFGGTQRLPRVIGLPRALDIILAGKVLPAKRAYQSGLLDEVLPIKEGEEDALAFRRLLDRAKQAITLPPRKRPLPFKERLLTHTLAGRLLVEKQARASIRKETKGHYPAPFAALKVAVSGLGKGLERGLAEERRELGRLIVSPESKALTHLFFISEDSQKLGRHAKEEVGGAKVCVVGGGTMGGGIAASCIASGFQTTVVEPFEAPRNRVIPFVRDTLEKRRSLAERERARLMALLQVSDSLEGARGADVVIEAIIEDRDKKRELFNALLPLLGDRAILASNTSSIPIEELGYDTPYASRLVGMHFFNPAERMPLVEIIRSQETSERTIAFTAAFTAALGKYPVVVEDVPGFLVNKILTPYLGEASFLLGEGYSVKDVDQAAVKFGFPMGPFRLLDEIGLDVAEKVAKIMERSYGLRMKGEGYIEKLVAKSMLGKKNGRGFYLHSSEGVTDNPELYSVLGLRGERKTADLSLLTRRLTLAMANEGLRSLRDGVAGSPSPEAEAQIDLASVMGFGFPPFLGGLIHYCHRIGIERIRKELEELQKVHGERFAPWDREPDEPSAG